MFSFLKGLQKVSWLLLFLWIVLNVSYGYEPNVFDVLLRLLTTTIIIIVPIAIIELVMNPVFKRKRMQRKMLKARENLKEIKSAEQFEKLVIERPGVLLMPGERCYYNKCATAVHQKNVVTGRMGTGAGMSFRVAKGVSLRTGGGASQVIRENINECFDGTLYITNMRIILHSPKYGFDIHVSKISQLSYNIDGFQVYSGAKCHLVMTKDIAYVSALIDLMNEYGIFKDEKSLKDGKDNSKKDLTSELRDLKELFDEGVISQEEFSAKKKQLLGL